MEKSNALLKARKASLENILFHVEQHEMNSQRTILTDYNFSGQYSSAIYCPSMNKVLHLSGRNYTLVTNEELISPIYDKLSKLFGKSGLQIECLNEDDRRFSARFILKEKVLQVANKDFVNAMIEVQNSYDGTLRHSISLSFYRKICENGMMGWRQESNVSHKHNSDYLLNLDQVLTRLNKLEEDLQKFQLLSNRTVTSKEIEQISEALKASKYDQFPKKLIGEVPMQMYREVEALESKPNAWLLYNAYNRLLNHDDRVGLAMDIKERVDRNVLSTISKELHLN
jgi:hypothetical protein